MSDYPKIDFLYDLAEAAGNIIKSNFMRSKASWKKDKTPLTKADTEINDLVIDWISENYPNISIIAEERSHIVENPEYIVFCDPVDGTFPFIWDMPVTSFCIAVVTGDDMPIIGVIYDPFVERMWWAGKGDGAYLDTKTKEKELKVSQRKVLDGSSVCITFWKDSRYNTLSACTKLNNNGAICFDPKSIAYPGGLVAQGKIEATIHPGKRFWETAAMQVIVEEAGGKATDIFGNKILYNPQENMKGHIISNGLIHDELVALVKSCQ